MGPYMEKIITIIGKKYEIDSIDSISIFDVRNSKYSTEVNHWIIKTKGGDYFLKKHPKSYIGRIQNEIDALTSLEKLLLIPKIIATTDNEKFVALGENIYIIYQYIHAKNLKDLKTSKTVFLSALCDIQNNLIKTRRKIVYYDFKKHLHESRLMSKKILTKITPTKNNQNLHDFNYLSFLMNESINSKQDFNKIKSTLVHGDIMLQNILKNKQGFWIIDWEKSKEYVTVIDVLKSITLALLTPSKKNLGLNRNHFVRNSVSCFSKIKLPKNEIRNALELFYFHLITNTSTLEKIYLDNQNLVSSINEEDFVICKWIKKNKSEIQLEINNKFKER